MSTRIWFAAGVLAAFLAMPCQAVEETEAANAVQTADLPILMYHHVLKTPECLGAYTISPDELRGDFEWLVENGYTAVSVSDLLAYEAGERELPEKPVMITFDDGQESFLAYVVPLLEEYDLCAVMAVVGSYTDCYTENEDHHINYSYLNWWELQELNRSDRVEIISHTYDLHGLNGRTGCQQSSGETDGDYCAMLNQDAELLEERFAQYLGCRPNALAYPYGAYCGNAEKVLVQRGYEVLFTCNEMVNHLTGETGELLHLGRFNRPTGIDRTEFFAKFSA